MTTVVGGLIKIAPDPPIYPSCTINATYSLAYLDVVVGGSVQPAASYTATDGKTIIVAASALWMPSDNNYLGITTDGQTGLLTGMGNITSITLSGTPTQAYTLAHYATNLVQITFNPPLTAGHVIVASGNVYVGGALQVTTINPDGPSWTTGSGQPTEPMPRGSLYSSSDAAHPLWVSTGNGAWSWVAFGVDQQPT